MFKRALRGQGAVFLTVLSVFISFLYGQGETHLGVWVVRDQLYNRKSIDQFIQYASVNGFTDLFIQVRGRGDAYYRSELVAPALQIAARPNFDPLAYVLAQAHRRQLKVHAWVNVYLLWSADERPQDAGHLLNQHPEWCTVDADGNRDIGKSTRSFRKNNTEGIYLSPLVPEVHQYLLKVIQELVANYNVDGIHLDYIRYPNKTYDYNDIGRRRFKATYGVDPILLSISNKSFFTGMEAQLLETLTTSWAEFRRSAITELVSDIKGVVRSSGKPIRLSAAVKPDPFDAKHAFYQEWEKWLQEGLLDFAVPMNYTRNNEQFESILKKIEANLGNDQIWVGIGIYNQGRYEALTKVMLALTNDFPNIVLFSYKTLLKQSNYFPTLQRAFIYHPQKSP